MTKERLFALHSELTAKGLEILKQKNADYSKETPLGNFYLSEALQTCSAENGIVNRMGDKLSRLVSVLAKGAQVKDETLQDTIVDVINYSVLLAAVIEDRRHGEPDAQRTA